MRNFRNILDSGVSSTPYSDIYTCTVYWVIVVKVGLGGEWGVGGLPDPKDKKCVTS